MPMLEALAALGPDSTFGGGCLDRTGPSVTAPLRWRNVDVWLVAQIEAGRVSDVRLHSTPVPLVVESAGACEAAMSRFSRGFMASGLTVAEPSTARFDGPLQRWTQTTSNGYMLKAAYRASRNACQVWLDVRL